jgi:lipoprotein-releasing system permease protein
MIHPLELFIGFRYTRAKRRNGFISFISVMATLGIVLGVTAMITVLSVMNGFGDELRSRILGVVSHVTIEKKAGQFNDWHQVIQKVKITNDVTGVAPYVSGQGMLTGERSSRPVIVRGVEPEMEKTVSTIERHMISGSIENLVPGQYGIIIGRELAWRLGVVPGSHVTLVANETLVTPAGLLPRFKQFTVVGIFEVGQGEYDNGFAMINIQDAAKVYRKGKGVSGVRVQLDDLFKAIPVAHELKAQLGSSFKVEDWSKQHQSFFRALRIEKSAMFITMTLIIAVAAFNIIAMLTMLISDKRTDIAILRTLGMSPNRAMTIFMYHGLLLGFSGTVLGVLGGVSLASNISVVIHFFESLTGVHLMTADVYYVSNIVAKLEWRDVTAIGLSAFVLTLLAAVYPARRAAMIQPAQALRYE